MVIFPKKFRDNVCSFFSRNAIIPNKKNIGLGSIVQAKVFLSYNSIIGKCVKIINI